MTTLLLSSQISESLSEYQILFHVNSSSFKCMHQFKYALTTGYSSVLSRVWVKCTEGNCFSFKIRLRITFHNPWDKFDFKKEPQIVKRKFVTNMKKIAQKSEKLRLLNKPRSKTSDFQLLTFTVCLPTSDFRFGISNYQILSPNFRLPTSDFRLAISDFQILASNFRVPTWDFQLQSRFDRFPLLGAVCFKTQTNRTFFPLANKTE